MPQMAPMAWLIYENIFLLIFITLLLQLFFLKKHHTPCFSLGEISKFFWKW